MHGCRDELARRNDVVELTEGIYQFVLRLVMREGQCSCLFFLESVLNRFGKEQFILQNRTAETKPRQRVAQAANVPASDAETGNELFQHAAPFFAPAFGFYGNDSRRKASVPRKKWRFEHLDRFDTVGGHAAGESSGSGIGNIAGIDQ